MAASFSNRGTAGHRRSRLSQFGACALFALVVLFAGVAAAQTVMSSQAGDPINALEVNERFGDAVVVSADGSRVVVGAPLSDAGETNGGQVRVFDLVGGAWTPVGDSINAVAVNAGFGDAVAVSADGSRAVVGAPLSDEGELSGGQVSVFELVAGVWSPVGPAVNGVGVGDAFGSAVAMSDDGSRIVAGAPKSDAATTNGGQVRIFDLVGGAWTQVAGDVNALEVNEGFGEAVATSADGARVVVGAPMSDAGATNGGQVRAFDIAADEPVLMCNGLEVTIDLSMDEVPTEGDDVIRGTSGDDVIDALGGNDTICSLQGDDTVSGGDGADKIFAGAGNDRLNGGKGNDRLVGGAEADIIFGDNGNDRIQGGGGNDDLYGGNGLDRIAGGNGNDVIHGGASADRLFGNLGRDQMFGDGGNDVLRGGAWKDLMNGGSGADDGCTLTDPGGLIETRINCEAGVFGR